MKYSTPHPGKKMDVSKRFCDGEHKFLFEIKEGGKVRCAKIKIFC